MTDYLELPDPPTPADDEDAIERYIAAAQAEEDLADQEQDDEL